MEIRSALPAEEHVTLSIAAVSTQHVEIVQSIGLSKEDEERVFWHNANGLFSLGLDVGVQQASHDPRGGSELLLAATPLAHLCSQRVVNYDGATIGQCLDRMKDIARSIGKTKINFKSDMRSWAKLI